MAQKFMEAKMHKLSKSMGVVVTDNGQVQFMTTPEKEVIKPSVVVLSGRAWANFMEKGIRKVSECICQQREDEWMYHPRTKVLSVTANNSGDWSVAFQTYTLKGALMKDLTFVLDEKEWEELDKKADKITEELDAVKDKLGVKDRQKITKYQPSFNAESGIRCREWYFLREHAMDKGTDLCEEFQPDCSDFEVETSLKSKPDPLAFVRLFYVILIYRVGYLINSWMCTGCYGGRKRAAGSHLDFHGCQYIKRKVFEDYYDRIKVVMENRRVVPVWRRCWELLRLSVPQDSDTLLKDAKEVWNNKAALLDTMNGITHSIDDMPETLLVEEAADDVDFDFFMKQNIEWNYDSDGSDTGDGPSPPQPQYVIDGPPLKKAKVSSEPDSQPDSQPMISLL